MEFSIKTEKREEIINITREVEEAVSKILEEDKKRICNKKARACLVYTPHTTCAIMINENSDNAVFEDILKALREQFPKGLWEHDKTDGNADAHIKAGIIGASQTIPLQNSKLALGKWQGILLADFDGPRERRIIVEIL